MTEVQTKAGNRFFWLDVLRVLLCTGVMDYHYSPVRPATGPMCVDGFFVMSGFLLAAGFDRMRQKGGMDLCAFYKGKALRLLPTLAVSIIIGFFLVWTTRIFDPDLSLTPTWWYSNFRVANVLEYYNVPAWYMASEIAFIGLAPFLFVLYGTGKKTIFAAFILMAAYTYFLYGNIAYAEPFGYGLYYQPQTRLWQFLGGMLAWMVFSHVKFNKWAQLGSFLLFVFVVGLLYKLANIKQEADLNYLNFTFGFDAIIVLLFMLTVPCATKLWTPGSKPLLKAFSYAAALTYPVYLYHVPVLKWVKLLDDDVFGIHSEVETIHLYATIATVVLSVVSLRVLDRIFPVKRKVEKAADTSGPTPAP